MIMKSGSSPAPLKDNKSLFIHTSDYFSHSLFLIVLFGIWRLDVFLNSYPLRHLKTFSRKKRPIFFTLKTRDNLYLNKHVWTHISLDKMKL